MATEQDLTTALDQLFSLIDTLIADLENAPTNPDGSIPADHIQAILDKVNAERDKADAVLQQPTSASQPGTQAPGAPVPSES